MARKPFMPFEDLLELARQMLDAGETLTSVSLQQRAGGGSYSTTKKAVDQVLTERGLLPGAQPPAAPEQEGEPETLPQPIQDAITRLTAVATQQIAGIRHEESTRARRLLDTTRAEHEATVKTLHSQLEGRDAEIEALALAADQATEELDAARDQLAALEEELSQAREELAKAREEIASLKARLEAQQGLETLQARITELQAAVRATQQRSKPRPTPKKQR